MICLDKLPAENWCKARKRKYKRTHVLFHESSLYTKEQVGSAEIVPSAFAAVLDVRVNIYSMAFIVALISTDKVFWVFFPPHRDAPLSANNTQWQQRKQRILHIPGLLLLDQLQNRERDREKTCQKQSHFDDIAAELGGRVPYLWVQLLHQLHNRRTLHSSSQWRLCAAKTIGQQTIHSRWGGIDLIFKSKNCEKEKFW